MAIEVKHLSFSYTDHAVLSDVTFSVEKGQFLSILGPNGVGKSTLFGCMLGLLTDYTGQILINGKDMRRLDAAGAAREVACIPQSSRPVFRYSVFDVALMGATHRVSAFGTPDKTERERCQWALEKVGIGHLAGRCFHRLSGGEQQLVLLARALVQDAPVLLLDEPTANLDFGNQLVVLRQARALADEGYTVVQTTHNPEQSYRYSDRILAMKDGKILLDGTPQQVLTAEIMEALYQVKVDVVSLEEDRVRVCVPVER